jgi:hypothetical protein
MRRRGGYFFGLFETFAADFLTAGFLAGLSAASAIAFGLAPAFGVFGAVPVSNVLDLAVVLVVVFRATLVSAFGLSFGSLTVSSLAADAFDFFTLAGGFAGCPVSASFALLSGAAGLGSCSSNTRAFSQYSVERPSGRPSASHRWYACKRSFSSRDLSCIPFPISHIRAFMLEEHRSACEREEAAFRALIELGIDPGHNERLDLATL